MPDAHRPPVTVVVGAGLIGASLGLALTRAGHTVFIRDRDVSHALVASGLGAGSVAPVDPAAVTLVVAAVPPSALAHVIDGALQAYPHAIVTDVGSVKAAVLDDLVGRPIDLSRYVGSHPMAGSQHSGPLTAHANLFEDRVWIVVPHQASSPEAIRVVREVAVLCGSRVVILDVTEHDEAVAQVSHLPQLMSSLTAGRLNDVPRDHLRLAGQGLRDVTRIASSDPDLWLQIVAANAPALRTELAAVHEALSGLLEMLDDPAAVHAFLERGRSGARALPGKHGTAAAEYADVIIAIPDAPGALASLFADVETAGFNVEDLSIEHDDARQVGYLSISVAPERAEGLERAMTEAGWDVRQS